MLSRIVPFLYGKDVQLLKLGSAPYSKIEEVCGIGTSAHVTMQNIRVPYELAWHRPWEKLSTCRCLRAVCTGPIAWYSVVHGLKECGESPHRFVWYWKLGAWASASPLAGQDALAQVLIHTRQL